MDINSVLHFVSSQIEKIIGVVAALFIATTALLIFRSIKEEKSEGGTGGQGPDATSIEDALRRVLAQTPLTTRVEHVERSSSVEPAGNGADDGKDERINALQSALQKAQTLLKERLEATAAASDEAASAETDAAHLELKKQVDELRARLSEYEIIEDDIADLAMFKEENARLKQEVETFKASAALVEQAPSPKPTAEAPVPVEAAPSVLDGGVEVLGDLVDADKLLDEVNAADAEDLMSEFKDKGKP